MSFAEELRVAAIARHERLFRSPAPASRAPRPRPVSPFAGQRPAAFMSTGRPVALQSLVVPVAAWRQVVVDVAARHQVSVKELMSDSRQYRVVHARQEAFYLIHLDGKLSTLEIGRRFGGKDHTTVMHGIRAHKERMGAQ